MKKNKESRKMQSDTLQEFLAFRKRGHKVPAKKGKGSVYKRNKKVKAQD